MGLGWGAGFLISGASEAGKVDEAVHVVGHVSKVVASWRSSGRGEPCRRDRASGRNCRCC